MDMKKQNRTGLAASKGRQHGKEETSRPRAWFCIQKEGGFKQNAALISTMIIAVGVIGFIIFAVVPTAQPEGMPEGVHLNETLIDH